MNLVLNAPMRLANEFALVAACCRWPPSPARDEAVIASAGTVRSWEGVLQLAVRHRVEGLVHAALQAASVALPPDIVRELALRAQRIALRNALLTGESVRLQRALDAAGIATTILKGSALAQLAYGTLDLKQARDIDLLVAPDDAAAALRHLEDDGYALASPRGPLDATQRAAVFRYGKEIELVHGVSKTRVELQWRLAVHPLLLQGVGARSAARQTVTLSDGRALTTLADDDLFGYLCVHGAYHAWSRLKWLADLNALIVSRHGGDIARLYRHAESRSAGLCAGQALLLCQRILGLPLPADLAARLSADRRLARLTRIAWAAIHAPVVDRGRIATVLRNVGVPFLLGRGFAYYAAQAQVASVGLADVVRLPLPSGLHFLYPLLRLPFWLWRRGVTLMRGWS
ncbi:MAG: nucleotidyltransferase family protein [Pseudolabrys sp.]|nr:nucleotidyltransferase family protein [Pseudolabrys sp.]MDP2296949.1 nucleotidyltransferase family protein [Pseudolabrys sp.]